MYIARLDRPWLGTPFAFQGFVVATDAEFLALAEFCQYVFIDTARGTSPPPGIGVPVIINPDDENVQKRWSAEIKAASGPSRVATMIEKKDLQNALLPEGVTQYDIETTFEAEMPDATKASVETKLALKNLIGDLVSQRKPDLEALRRAADALERSMLRNPDPTMFLKSLRMEESYSFCHAVNSATVGVALAREMGLPRQHIHQLTMGLLLADIGKIHLPGDLLTTSARLTDAESDLINEHVKHGVEMAESLGSMSDAIIEVIQMHHERLDGSGYPEGLVGSEIPLLGRLAGLADSFDAITSERTYSEAIPVHEALKELCASPGLVHQKELIERLIQAIGAYPIGTIVELSDSRLAIVAALNRLKRLAPKVVSLTDINKQVNDDYAMLDLSSSAPRALTVKRIVEPEQFGVVQPDHEILGIMRRKWAATAAEIPVERLADTLDNLITITS